MNPKHTNPQAKDRVAHAPYNFVPLPEEIVKVNYDIPPHDRYICDSHYTGYIECDLKTLTPTYVRTGLKRELFHCALDNVRDIMRNQETRKSYAQFFSLDDSERPVIPGSTLRGAIRALLEIAGYGKMQWVTDNNLFFRSLDNSAIGKSYRDRMLGKVESGFLCKRGEKYFIKKCEMFRISRHQLGGVNNIYEGKAPNQCPKWHGKPSQYARIWVPIPQKGQVVQHIVYQFKNGYSEGRLIITGNMNNKKKEFVFLLPKPDAEEIEVPDSIIERFHDDDQITQWQERAFPKDKPNSACRPRDGALRKDSFLAKEGDPVFFLREDKKLVFFGRAQMFRLPYRQSPLDLVPENLRRCDDDALDLAEAIFGYTPEGKRTTATAGRVYFTDAVCTPGQRDVWLFEEPRTPQVLAAPKPTCFQHYLVQDKNKLHDPDYKDKLAHYGSPTPEQTVIRGHKLYWHKPQTGFELVFVDDNINWDADRQHTQIRPVKPAVNFRFRVYFTNLTKVELGALLWVLNLPPGHSHKIGMAKPLGLGSVAITAKLVLTDRLDRYKKLLDDSRWYLAEREETQLDQFLTTFEQYILTNMSPQERRSAKTLRDLPRINMLLKMLKYPGPASNTDYMSLNEFSKRPVLPDPSRI